MNKVDLISNNVIVDIPNGDPPENPNENLLRQRLKIFKGEHTDFLERCVEKIAKDPRVGKIAKDTIYCADNTKMRLLDQDDLNDDEKVVYSMFLFLLTKDTSPKMTAKMLESILLERDPKFFKIACDLMQRIFDSIAEQVDEGNPEFDKKAGALIGNLIALLPFFNPELIPSKEIKIPQKINNEWKQVTFKIGRTALQPHPFAAKFFGEPIDIVELEPINQEGARSIRSFQGTTFPAGKGMMQTLLADTFPFASVGEMFFLLTPGAIQKSMDRASTEKVDVYGQRLGGAMALITSLAYPDKVENATTYVAPKLYSWTISKYLKPGKKFTPKVTCYVNENDSVCRAGNALPPGTQTIMVMGEKIHDKLSAHAKAATGQDNVVMVKLDPKKVEGWSAAAVIHMIIAPFLFTILAITWLVWRVLVTLFHTLPVAAIDAIIEKIDRSRQNSISLK